MANPSLDFKLDEDFLFILNFARDSMHLFENRPVERTLIESWFEKLCLQIYRGIDAKRLRNLYLVKLVTNVQSGVLRTPFLTNPPTGPLEPLPQSIVPSNLDEPPWLKEFEAEAAGMGASGAKDFTSYLCTKQLEDGRGLCAYLAVSVADEGQKPRWFEMGSGKPMLLAELDAEIEEEFQRFMGRLSEGHDQGEMTQYKELLLKAVQREIGGLAAPGDDVYLEELLLDFGKYIANKSMGHELESYDARNKRMFMLGYLEKKLQVQLEEERQYRH